jgi:hypothetical protein
MRWMGIELIWEWSKMDGWDGMERDLDDRS